MARVRPDERLVKTLAAFILPLGATLACAARRPASPEVWLLGGGSAAALGGASVRIPRVCCSTV